MKKDLPIYDIILDEADLSQGVAMISLVDEPAIGVNWIKLSHDKKLFFKADVEKKLLYGPFLIPNMLIYRSDVQNGEYYVRFSSEEIEKIAWKFNSDLNARNINFQHSDVSVEASVVQNWIIEGDFDKSKNYNFDLPEGTWFGAVKINDTNFWLEKVKTDEVRGFSVEILADLQVALIKNNKENMEDVKLGSATIDGTTIYWVGELTLGTPIFIDSEMTQPAPDGEWLIEGKKIITSGGVVSDMPDVVAEDTTTTEPTEDMEPDVVDEVPTEDVVEPEVKGSTITPEEVSMMIDSRFGELMDEITKLKVVIETLTNEAVEFKKDVNEKFSITPATESIKKVSKLDDSFKKAEDRIRNFYK